MAELPYDATNLPVRFVVKRNVNGREGYVFFKTTLQTGAEGEQPWRKASADRHFNLYYHIHTDNQQTDWKRCALVKAGGSIKREIQWRHSNERLIRGTLSWPVLSITGFDYFPGWNAELHFAPITTPVPATPALPAAPAPQPIQGQTTIKIHPIPTIPQHALRALLTQAVFNEEMCPIMDVPVDCSNGAVTSCFHIFDKTALERWLKQPNSGQKCPVCNQPCNSYTLPPEDDVVELPEDDIIEIQGEA